MERDPLELDSETMRQLGYQTIDWLVDRATRRRDEPVLSRLSPLEMARDADGGAPLLGQELSVILDQLATDVLPFRSRIDHPRYLAYVPGEGTWPGALGDLIASAYNIDAGNWMESAGPSHLEVLVLRWFAEWIGYPDSASGVLVSGGSAANLTALACAREALVGAMSEDLVAYVSDQGHSSLARAARILGFRPQQVRVLPVGRDFRMRVDALVAAIDADLEAGRRPLVVLAVAGTTNTGAVDPLPDIAAVCREHGMWLHVDAAYGGFAAITPRGRDALAGLELADSVTLDPHKWLYQPIECGALLVREGHLLREAFEIHPDYLQDALVRDTEVNFADHGLQLTRTSRALKIWLSVHYFGLEAFASAVNGAMDLAQDAQRYIEASSDLELMSPATLGIVCFRRHPRGQDEESRLEEQRRPRRWAGGQRQGAGVLHTVVRAVHAARLHPQPQHNQDGRRGGTAVVRSRARAVDGASLGATVFKDGRCHVWLAGSAQRDRGAAQSLATFRRSRGPLGELGRDRRSHSPRQGWGNGRPSMGRRQGLLSAVERLGRRLRRDRLADLDAFW